MNIRFQFYLPVWNGNKEWMHSIICGSKGESVVEKWSKISLTPPSAGKNILGPPCSLGKISGSAHEYVHRQ